VFGAVDVFDFLAKIVAHVLSWMFVIGVAGTVLLAIPVAAYQLFSVLFEKDRPDEKETPLLSQPYWSKTAKQKRRREKAMATPKLTNVSWLGPKDEMDRASHLLGKCSECFEIICVEKAVANPQDTQQETNEMIYKAFGAHVKLKHSEEASQAARQIETRKTFDDYRKKVGS
jgi:hypothetical protein